MGDYQVTQIGALDESARSRIIAITLAGELHHLYPDFENGVGEYENIQVTDYSPESQADFRSWLQKKYGTLEQLNQQWWTTFWSHTYTDWSQIESPAPQGEVSIHGLNLDWHRFNTAQVTDFCRHEIAPLKAANAALPVTGGVVLVILSVVLTLIGGLIPSRKAAKQDPATALRTE